MAKLTGLPPEIRNNIYDLLIVHDAPIPVASPRKKHVMKKQQDHSNFACLLRVNKKINQEAKTLFYARNAFIIGNGYWGSTHQANLQALKEFIRRVPKDCISLIRQIELDICLAIRYFPNFNSNIYHYIRKEEIGQMETIGRALLKYFTGLVSITATVLPLSNNHRNRLEWPQDDLVGDIRGLATPMRKILALPSLKQLHFKYESARNIKALVEAVLEGEGDVKGRVKMVRRDGSFVPLS